MIRRVISTGALVFALLIVAIVESASPVPAAAAPLAESGRTQLAAAQSGELVTQEELCAFRAPLFVASEQVPAACTSVVEWLRRVINVDMDCGDQWLQRGAIPDCALPYR